MTASWTKEGKAGKYRAGLRFPDSALRKRLMLAVIAAFETQSKSTERKLKKDSDGEIISAFQMTTLPQMRISSAVMLSQSSVSGAVIVRLYYCDYEYWTCLLMCLCVYAIPHCQP